MDNGTPIPKEAMDVLEKVNTGMLIDALAMSSIQGGIIGIFPLRGFEDRKIIGRASTVEFAPPRPDTQKLTMYGCISAAPEGSVLIVDAKGINGHVTGDNVAAHAKNRGLAGIVINGCARDVIGLREVGLPVWAIGLATRQPSNMQLSAREVPVTIGSTRVQPGDVIMADEDGVVVVPAASLDAVLENMKTIFEVEEGMAKAIASRASADEIGAILAKKKAKR